MQMTRANTFLTESSKQLFQYAKFGNTSKTIGNTEKILEPGIYKIGMTMEGDAIFSKTEVKSDLLLNLRNKKRQDILAEFKKFWTPDVKSKFEGLGLIHKRGFIYEGPPGTGKSCDMKLLMNEMVSGGDVIFIAEDASTLTGCLKQFKEVEPDRHVAVIMEDFERMADWGEHALLELLDGPNAVGGVFYLATTNFINRISERLKRKSRFDRVIHVGLPEYEDRLEYFKNKLGQIDTDENIQNLAKQTAGRNFADLKDIIVAIYCLGNSLEEVMLEMRGGQLEETGSKFEDLEFTNKLNYFVKMNHSFNENKEVKIFQTQLKRLFKSIWGVEPEVKVEEVPSMTEKTRARNFLEIYGSIDRKPLSDHELASPRMATPKDQAAMDVAQKPTTPSGLMPNESPEGQEPIDADRVIKQMSQRLDLLDVKGISIEGVECDDDGSIFVTFADQHGNEMDAEFNYDDNDQSCVYVDDYEMSLGDQMPGAITTPAGKYINLYDPGFLDKGMMLDILTQGGLIPTKDRTVNMGKDAYGNRLPIPTGV